MEYSSRWGGQRSPSFVLVLPPFPSTLLENGAVLENTQGGFKDRPELVERAAFLSFPAFKVIKKNNL